LGISALWLALYKNEQIIFTEDYHNKRKSSKLRWLAANVENTKTTSKPLLMGNIKAFYSEPSWTR
jgi:hypothetical protein